MMEGKQKGVIGLFLIFIIMAVVLAFLFGVGLPLVMAVNIQTYEGGEDILHNINVSDIEDATVRDALNDSITSAKTSTTQSIDILSAFYQYSWLIIILVLTLIIFMYSRTNVETMLT